MQLAKSARVAAAIAMVALVVACQPQRRETAATPAARVEMRHAHADIYKIDGVQSSIMLQVYRDGPLARFGHNHVIAVEQIGGVLYREKTLSQSEFELSFPVAAMVIDRAADRAAAGSEFSSAVAPEAIAGTRENMVGPKLLAALQYPVISLRSVSISGSLPDLQMVVAIKVRNIESLQTLPVHVSEQNATLIADGEVSLSQARLGLAPYSVLGGGLRVSDTIKARFHLVAQRASGK